MQQVSHCDGVLELVYHSAFHNLSPFTSTLIMIHPYDSLLKATVIERAFFHNRMCRSTAMYNTRFMARDHFNGLQPLLKYHLNFTSQNVSCQKNTLHPLRFTVVISSYLFGSYFSDVLRPCPMAISPLKNPPESLALGAMLKHQRECVLKDECQVHLAEI